MQAQCPLIDQMHEQAGYFEVPGAHLYTVLHQADDPVARVLLVGPFASERHRSYGPWVEWARYLVRCGVEVLRYDYRGVGESSGTFEEFSFEHWSEDVLLLANWLKKQSPRAPVVLHGLEVGALLAGRAFHAGVGDMLLMWSPPATANQALRSELLRRVALQQILRWGDYRKPASEFIREAEQGRSIEVAGYEWSSRLWRDSFGFDLPQGVLSEAGRSSETKRPVRIVNLTKDAAPFAKGGLAVDDQPKDLTWLFDENWTWMANRLAGMQGGDCAAGD